MIDQHTSLGEKFLKKWVWLYVFGYIIAPIGYIIKIIISHELSVSEVGIIYGIISLITMISAFNDMGMSESMNHFIPRFLTGKNYGKIKTILCYALIAQMTTWILIAALFFWGANVIANMYFHSPEAVEVLQVFALYFLWINVFQVLSMFFMSVQNTFLNKVIDLFRMSFSLISVVCIWVLSLSSMLYFSYAWIIGLYIWLCIAWVLFYKKYYIPYFYQESIIWEKSFFKEIFSYASIVFLWAQAWTILSQIDMQMILYILGTQEAWYYTNYLSIITIPFLIFGPIFWMLFPVFSELYAQWESKKIQNIKSKLQKNFIAISLHYNFLFFIFAPVIAIILFWEKFIISGYILQYSILFLVFNFLLQINFNIMAWVWKVRERVRIICLAIVFNIVMNIICIHLLWVYGAALATWLWWLLIFILSERSLKTDFRTHISYNFIVKNIIWSGIIGLSFYLIFYSLFQDPWRIQNLCILIAISIIWTLLIWVINKREFINIFQKLKELRLQ